MADEVTFTLPKPPILLGEENLEEWKAAIHNHFEWYNIEDYLLQSINEPVELDERKKWKHSRLQGKIIIHSTLTNKAVRDKLKNAGWNPLNDSDPKELYELVLRIVPSTSEEALSSLYLEFSSLNRNKYDSLSAFQTRVTCLKNRLEALNCLPPEKGNLIIVINALKTTYPDWHNFLMYDFENKELTWKKLMEDISKRATHELSQMSLLAANKTADSNSNKPLRNSNTDKSSNPRGKYIDCTTCGFKHMDSYKWCEQCKQHEGDHWEWCAECKKHHSNKYSDCKGKTAAVPSNASAGALNTSTGLPFGSTRLAQMTINSDWFEHRYITRDSILLDSACFNHIFNDKKWFIEYDDIDKQVSFGSSNGSTSIAIGRGVVRIPLQLPDGSTHMLELPNTLYQPATPCNLLSAGQLDRNSVIANGFDKTLCYRDTKNVLAQYTIIDSVFVISTAIHHPVFATQPRITYQTLHRRLLHCSHNKLMAVAKSMGLSFHTKEYTNFDCETCNASKAKAQISREVPIPVSQPLHEIHADSIHHSKLGVHGFRYSTYMLDACTGYHWIFFAQSMRDIATKLITWGNEIHNLTGRMIHEFFIDGGREFLRIKEWANAQGVQIRNTPPDTPEPRGRIERAGAVITTMARSAMIDANLPASFWPYAEAWAVKVLNLLPTSSNISPHQQIAQLLHLHDDFHQPFVKHIRIFGATAWLLLKGQNAPLKGDKAAPRAIKGRYLGSCSQKGHVVYVWIPSKHQITTARDVTIVETSQHINNCEIEEPEYIAQWESEEDDDQFISKVHRQIISAQQQDYGTTCDVIIQDIEPDNEEAIFATPPITPARKQVPAPAREQEIQSMHEILHEPESESESEHEADLDHFLDQLNDDDITDLRTEEPATLVPPNIVEPTIRQSSRSARRDYKAMHTGKESKKKLAMVTIISDRQIQPRILALSTMKATDQHKAPKSYFDARKRSDWSQWKPAFEKQFNDLQSRNIWDLVDLPTNAQLLPGRWVLDMKFNAQGEWDRNRARWVVCGNYENTESWAAQDVYAAVANSTSVKMFFTLVAVNDIECNQYDIITAFLNAKAKGDLVYVEQPHGFTDGTRRVCRLNQALYGLRKSAL